MILKVPAQTQKVVEFEIQKPKKTKIKHVLTMFGVATPLKTNIFYIL